jgi:nicotinamide phosphoribosyltransferase
MSYSIVLDTDSYKVSMWKQYPPGTEYVYSYISSRGGKYDYTLFFGLQSFLQDLEANPVTAADVEFADKFWTAHGEPFNREGWDYIVNTHGGKLPIKVYAIPEGTVLPTKNVLATIVNTDPKCYWLTTWLETAMLRAVWYGTTVATQSYSIKQVIKHFLVQSGDVAGLPFKLHDFGSRGVSSQESAALGGAAHLVNFMGTDTAVAILHANKYYDADLYSTGFSIPAAEHSTITSWGRGAESLAYENIVTQFSKPGSIYAVVSDSYDIFNAVDNLWGAELREQVIASGGTLVIRPDSGDPCEVLPKLLTSLEKSFGVTVNDKGYKVLNNVRLIWGDGINELTIRTILGKIVNVMNFSADNLAFGMGGALLQIVNRDDLRFAMKASAIFRNGEWVGFSKDPITDSGKKSLEGLVTTVVDDSGNYVVIDMMSSAWHEPAEATHLVFMNGVTFNRCAFDEVRANSNQDL